MKIYCPYCRKEVEYNIEKRKLKSFKGVEINSFEDVAVCKECKNDLYINELENQNSKRILEIYRKKLKLINPDDIINFRKKYNISQRELTGILDFGKMTINRYERGGLPTKSQSDYIKLFINDENMFINKAKEAFEKNAITKKTYEKIISKEHNNQNKFQDNLRNSLKLDLYRNPDIYNGYKTLNLEKIENIISYIACNSNNLTITSLNKYLWFIDMLSFKERSIAITGLTYQNQKFGPTIINKDYDKISLLDEKYNREDFETENGNTTKILSKKNFDMSEFSKEEMKVINKVIEKLKNKTVSEISELSHQEEGWKKTKRNEKISFEYAEKLKFGS